MQKSVHLPSGSIAAFSLQESNAPKQAEKAITIDIKIQSLIIHLSLPPTAASQIIKAQIRKLTNLNPP